MSRVAKRRGSAQSLQSCASGFEHRRPARRVRRMVSANSLAAALSKAISVPKIIAEGTGDPASSDVSACRPAAMRRRYAQLSLGDRGCGNSASAGTETASGLFGRPVRHRLRHDDGIEHDLKSERSRIGTRRGSIREVRPPPAASTRRRIASARFSLTGVASASAHRRMSRASSSIDRFCPAARTS